MSRNISYEFAMRQIGRMEGLENYPRGEAGVEELVNALIDAARTESHATKIINTFCDNRESIPRCPNAGRIRAVAWELLPSFDKQQPRGCERCDGTGFISEKRFIEGNYKTGGGDYWFARPCNCQAKPQAPAVHTARRGRDNNAGDYGLSPKRWK